MRKEIEYLLYVTFLITMGVASPVFCFAGENYIEQKIQASDASPVDRFGWSVSGTESYAIVGAINADGNSKDSGVVYVFERSGTLWIQVAQWTASDGATHDQFGSSVSARDNFAVIGARKNDSSGSAYVFEHNGTSWSQVAKLTASDGSDNDLFAHSLCATDNYVIIGAYGDDEHGENSGAAYIFKRNGTSWLQVAKITASDGSADDFFGYTVSMTENYAIVGAYGDDDNGDMSGAAYIFKHTQCPSDAWIQVAKLTASDGTANDYFGWSVSVNDNFAVIGAVEDRGDGTMHGSAYIFKSDNDQKDSWTEAAKLTADDPSVFNFGASVSAKENYAIIGAPETESWENPGWVYIFKYNKRCCKIWHQVAKLTTSDSSYFKLFGAPLVAAGNYFLVGACEDDEFGDNAGSAYIFERDQYEEDSLP